jgi:protoporphyrinogen oxidase
MFVSEIDDKGYHMTIGILGGGLSGITFQKHLNCESEILEKEQRLGGLCRSFSKDGFIYDIGGHILFSKKNDIIEHIKTILDGNLNYNRRANKVLFKERYVKYPFENGLSELSQTDAYECLIDFIKNDFKKPINFRDWIYYTFGKSIAEKYLIPYNTKIWKNSPDQMGLEWVERVPRPPIEDIVKSAMGIETEGYVHQLYFYYPRFGGIESLIKSSLKKNGKVRTATEITSIKKKNDEWVVSDGTIKNYYKRLVLTIPVTKAVRYIENTPQDVIDAASNLKHNAVRIVLVGVNNDKLLDKSAIYVPREDILFHRICYMGYFSKNNVPAGKSSLIAEITTNKDNELFDLSDGDIIERVIEDIKKLNILDKNDVTVVDIANIEYGYVVYDLNYKKNIKIVRDYFDFIGIDLLGRFGEFEYINMDEIIRRSIYLAGKYNNEI